MVTTCNTKQIGKDNEEYKKKNKEKEYGCLTIVSKEEGTSTPGGSICFKI